MTAWAAKEAWLRHWVVRSHAVRRRPVQQTVPLLLGTFQLHRKRLAVCVILRATLKNHSRHFRQKKEGWEPRQMYVCGRLIVHKLGAGSPGAKGEKVGRLDD